MNRVGDESGFTITELMVALTVFAVLVIGVAATQASGFRVIGHSSARQSAVQIASRELETLRSIPFDSLGHDVAPPAAAAPDPDSRIASGSFAVPGGSAETFVVVGATSQVTHKETVTGENLPFTIYRYVTVPGGSTTMKRVTITVTWVGGSDVSRRVVNLSTLVSSGSLTW